MFPLVLLDRSQLKQTCNCVITSFPTANHKIRVIRLFRSFLEKIIESISGNDKASRDMNPTPRYLTHSLGKKLFKTYIISNLLHTTILTTEVILGFASLSLKMDPLNWPSVDSNVFPYRVLCLLNIGSLGQENLDIFQCTLPYQYTIIHILVYLLFYMIMMIFFNIIHLIISLYVYWNKSYRRSEWIHYFDSQISNQFDNTHVRHFIDYMDIDGYSGVSRNF